MQNTSSQTPAMGPATRSRSWNRGSSPNGGLAGRKVQSTGPEVGGATPNSMMRSASSVPALPMEMLSPDNLPMRSAPASEGSIA